MPPSWIRHKIIDCPKIVKYGRGTTFIPVTQVHEAEVKIRSISGMEMSRDWGRDSKNVPAAMIKRYEKRRTRPGEIWSLFSAIFFPIAILTDCYSFFGILVESFFACFT